MAQMAARVSRRARERPAPGRRTGKPVNTTRPRISGSAVEGEALKATRGTWLRSPTSYSFKWQDCDAAGGGCETIAGASGKTLTLTAAEVGHRLRVHVTATNGGGSTTARSAATAIVVGEAPAAPSSVEAPVISGATVEGQTLSASSGIWSGSPTSYSYRWQLCDALGDGCLRVAGGTRSSYKLRASDVGGTMRVIVTATNAGGSGEATAAASAKVVAENNGEEPKEEKEKEKEKEKEREKEKEEGAIKYGTLAHPFAAGALTNTEVSPTAELATHSTTIIKQLDGGNGGGTLMQGFFNFTPVIHYATSSTPWVNMYEYEGGCVARKVQIEPGWWPEPSDEGHMAILESSGEEVDTWRGAGPREKTKVEDSRAGEYGEQTRAEEESKGCYRPGEWKTITLFTGANWKTGSAEGGGDDGPHIPEAATAISQQDLESNRYYWGHALAWAGYAYNCKRTESWCGSPRPAISQDGRSTNQEIAVPEGARERLEPSFNCTRDTGTLGAEIRYLWEEQWCNTLKKFGMMSTDSSEHTSGVYIRQAQMGSWTGGYVPPWHENGSTGRPIEAVRGSGFLTEAQCSKQTAPPNWLYGAFGVEEAGKSPSRRGALAKASRSCRRRWSRTCRSSNGPSKNSRQDAEVARTESVERSPFLREARRIPCTLKIT